MTSTGTGKARSPAVSVVNNDVPTDPVALAALRIEQADAAVASAERKVAKQEAHLAAAEGKGKKDRQRGHLKAAQEALAQAIAQRKELG